MDHVSDRSHQIDGVQHVYRLRAVRHRDSDPVVLPYAEHLQRPRAEIDLVDHVLVVEMLSHEIHGDRQRMLFCLLLDLFVHRAVEILDSERQLSAALVPWYLHFFRHREYDIPLFIQRPFVSHNTSCFTFPYLCLCMSDASRSYRLSGSTGFDR